MPLTLVAFEDLETGIVNKNWLDHNLWQALRLNLGGPAQTRIRAFAKMEANRGIRAWHALAGAQIPLPGSRVEAMRTKDLSGREARNIGPDERREADCFFSPSKRPMTPWAKTRQEVGPPKPA